MRYSQGFSLIEMLVVISITSLLLAILLPVLAAARQAGQRVMCMNHARQMTQASLMYANDHQTQLFPMREEFPGVGRLWWFGFEPFGGSTVEGERELDRTRGRLWPYYQMTDSIEICPAYPLDSARYKPKFATNWTTYGHPLQLMDINRPTRLGDLQQPGNTPAFVDASQINTFQSPASPANPMFEQWHYISRFDQTVLYLHSGSANAAMYDGHVKAIEPEFGVDQRIVDAPVGRPPSDLILQAN